jgi:LmbE family N-acetylglucosaminyl deacetylase
VFHEPLAGDLEIFYEKKLLAKMGSVMRSVAPDILLVHSPEDYMEDHMNACRLAVTAAFCRGMRNFQVDPPCDPVFNDVTVYHAQPHGNKDLLNRLVLPDFFVDISSVIGEKSAMLSEHKSQKQWLELSQGFDAYVEKMKDLSREMGKLSGQCEFAEGWRRHNPLGLCSADANPMDHLLKNHMIRRREPGNPSHMKIDRT